MAETDSVSVHQAAVEYIARGYRVVPVPHGTKAPVIKGWQQLRINAADVSNYFLESSNIGLILGECSLGLVDIDLDSPEAVVAATTLLPWTNMCGGRPSYPQSHYFYRAEGCRTVKFEDPIQSAEKMLLEVRSDAHHTVVPPSIHPSGEPYEWFENGPPSELTSEQLLCAAAFTASAALIGRYWPDKGGRHDAALAVCGALLNSGWQYEDVEEFLKAILAVGHDDEVDDRMQALVGTQAKIEAGDPVVGWGQLKDYVDSQAVSRARQWLEKYKPKVVVQRAYDPESHTSDLGNARRLWSLHQDELRYCKELGWLAYDGTRWRPGSDLRVRQWAHDIPRHIIEVEAAAAWNAGDKKIYGALVEHALDTEKSRNISAMLKETEALAMIDPDDLDANRWVLNCANGTLDLEDLQLVAHDPTDLITKVIRYPYDKTAKCPEWLKFLKQMQPEESVRVFLQRLAGYCLTGDTMERSIFVFYGSGRNGKGTFLNTLAEILGIGEYATNVAAATLMTDGRRGGNSRPDLAKLRGVRFVVSGESNDGDHLDEALIKDLTGGTDPITARHLYKEEFTYRPQLKLFLPTNHKPTVTSAGEAIWDRIKPLPWLIRIAEDKVDKKLPDRLLEEAPGILAWAVEGLRRYYDQGLAMPPVMVQAANEYRAEGDILAHFMEDCCEDGGDTPYAELFEAYAWWCRKNGFRHSDQSIRFGKRVREKYPELSVEVVSVKGKKFKAWRGIQVKPEARPGAMVEVMD